jgi:hypothetical protein
MTRETNRRAMEQPVLEAIKEHRAADDGSRYAGRHGVSRRVGRTQRPPADAAAIVDPPLAAAGRLSGC